MELRNSEVDLNDGLLIEGLFLQSIFKAAMINFIRSSGRGHTQTHSQRNEWLLPGFCVQFDHIFCFL